MFSEAHTTYCALHLQGAVPPVTQAQLDEQARIQREKYLTFPLPLDKIMTIKDHATLRFAAQYLSISLDSDIPTEQGVGVNVRCLTDRAVIRANYGGGCYRSAVGLDAEWKTVLFQNLDWRGASILQVI